MAVNVERKNVRRHPEQHSGWRRHFHGVPGGARFLRVQVPNPPGSGKDVAEGKGVHREVESEGSRMWGTY